MSDATTVFTPVKQFLVLDGDPPTLTALYRALDELAMAYHGAPDVQANDWDLDAPRSTRLPLVTLVANRFPKLGYYNRSDTTEPLAGPSLVAHALDDLGDIVRELRSSLWLLEHGHLNDALRHFRFGYEHHWGLHLRGLSHYLHELIYLQHVEFE